MGDFQKEQQRFLQEKKAKQTGMVYVYFLLKVIMVQPSSPNSVLGLLGAAVPPWVGYNEEDTVQQQILALSAVRIISKTFVLV